MGSYRADIHIHSVLSPCGDLEMSPLIIVKTACEKGLKIIGITDHNSTLHCELTSKLGQEHGILVLMGAEITTKEEIHCLAFFETTDQLKDFQKFLDENLPLVSNDPEKFGHQVVVNEKEEILKVEERLLTTAINASINKTIARVHELDGLFIPAHIDRNRFSIFSQLGFIPPDLQADAFEVTSESGLQMIEKNRFQHLPVFRSSDAHFPEQIGKRYSVIKMEELTFKAFRKALKTKGSINTW